MNDPNTRPAHNAEHAPARDGEYATAGDVEYAGVRDDDYAAARDGEHAGVRDGEYAAAWNGEYAAAWDGEYAADRYRGEPPVAFTGDIIAAACDAGARTGLYVGCGNGRNYLPLVAAGLDLTGLDISANAIAHLAERAPGRRDRLIRGDLTALPAGLTYPLVIGIQVFQHGDRAIAHAHIRAAQRRQSPGGLFCLRVNATGTDVWPAHQVTEVDPDDGGFTVRYLEGAKRGLQIHFFSAIELNALFPASGYRPVLPVRRHATPREPPAPGQWSQWEAIWLATKP